MGLNLANLELVRENMLDELRLDVLEGNVYFASRLSDQGRTEWVELLRSALQNGDAETLAADLRIGSRLLATMPRRKPKGGITLADVPVNAPETLAEGEFNRFYIRGLCVRAMADGIGELEVYRAKDVQQPRSTSTSLIGTRRNAEHLLTDLRTHQGVDAALGVPAGPNSGLSVRLPKTVTFAQERTPA